MVKLCLIFASVLAMTVALTIASLANAQEPKASATPAPEKKSEKSEKAEKKSAKHSDKKSAEKAPEKRNNEEIPKEVKKLIVQDTLQGTGKVASRGSTIKVNYTGWLYESSASMGRGKQFDSSVGKDAFSFKLGNGDVIKGWDEGFSGMKVGGKRKLIIPSELGYGERGAGNVIPPNSTLMFEVELLDVN